MVSAATGCLPLYELRPILVERETGTDFVFASPEARAEHPNRFSYEVKAASFGPLPRIVLEPRLRLEISDNLDLDAAVADTDSRALTRVRIFIDSGWYHEAFAYRVELQDSREVFGDAGDGEDALDLRQAYILLGGRCEAWGVKLGRQEIDLGTGALLGADWHDNVDRSFDGARLVLADRWARFEPRQWSRRLDVFAVKPVEVGRGFNSGQEDRLLAGAFYSDRTAFPLRLDGVLCVVRSDREDYTGEAGTGRDVVWTLGGTVAGERFGRADGVSLEAEAAVQFGRRGADPHRAAMASAEVAYVFPTPWRVKVRGGFVFASGDADPLDGKSGTFEPPFAGDLRDRLGLLRLAGLRNIRAAGAGVSFAPVEDFRIGADVRWLALDATSEDWLDADGAVPKAGLTGRALGREIDISGRYLFRSASGKEGRIEGGFAIFEAGAGLPAGTGSVTALYLETAFRF